MKRIITILFLVKFTLINILPSFGKDGYSFYQEHGKWGVLFNGEPCLLPRFSEVANLDEGGRFVYKENGKWGIANVWKIIAEPFCDSIVCLNDLRKISVWDLDYNANLTFYLFSNDENKWGVCDADGQTLIPPIYDEIYSDILHFYKTFMYPYAKMKNKILFPTNRYFLVKDKDSYKIIDICGTVLISNIVSKDYFFSKKGKKEISKAIRKIEFDREKSDKAAVENVINQAKMAKNTTRANILYKKYIVDGYASTRFKEQYEEEMYKPRAIYFGYDSERKGILPIGDTLIINGQKSIVNDYGFISTPLEYDSPYFRLQRNPTDIFAYLILMRQNGMYGHYDATRSIYISDDNMMSGYAENLILEFQDEIKSYEGLLELAENINDQEAYEEVQTRKVKTEKYLDAYREQYDKEVRRLNFIAKVDHFSNTATSLLTSMADALGGNSSSASYSSQSGTDSFGDIRSFSGSSASTKMSMSDQVNYNSLRSTYNKWASDLMQMKNSNGKYQSGYTQNEKRKAQSEMKRIRNNAKQKYGKDIPYNAMEDW